MKVALHAPLLALLSCAASTIEAQQPSVELAPNDPVWIDPTARRELVPVYIRNLKRSEVLGVTLQVRIDGRDVTNLVSPVHEVGFDLLSRTSRSGRRLDLFTLDLSALTLSPGQRIQYRASVTGAGFQLFDTATATAEEPEPQDQCVKDCVCAFVIGDLKAKKGGDGKVRFTGDVDGDGDFDGDDIRLAEENLRTCLAACDPPVTSIDDTFECTDANQNTLIVNIEVEADGSGNDATAHGFATEKAPDVVIAIGGNADPTSTSDGGDAKATATKPGAASLAIGGNGGPRGDQNGGNNPGAGGMAEAASTDSMGGDAYAVGGHGGNGNTSGGDGGPGHGTTKCLDATGFGEGGNGGDPIDNAKAGGKGGNGTGSRGSDATTVTGIGAGQDNSTIQPVPDGKHGEGGWGRSHSSGGSSKHGGTLTNVVVN